jgi:CheY-like chemotaxis protein
MAGGGTTRAQTLDQQYQIVIMTRVLVVEDDVLQRDALVNDLQAAGHEVVQCANGREAMAALEASDPRFGWLFTDIRLAGLLDGWAIADRARALNPDVLVVYAMSSTSDKPRKLPNSRHVTKPYAASVVLGHFAELAG